MCSCSTQYEAGELCAKCKSRSRSNLQNTKNVIHHLIRSQAPGFRQGVTCLPIAAGGLDLGCGAGYTAHLLDGDVAEWLKAALC